MEPQTLAIFGATNVSGTELARVAVAGGIRVVGIVRGSSDMAALEAAGAEVRRADCLDRQAVFAALRDLGSGLAVASLLGGAFRGDRREDSEGNINAIDAAGEAGARRLVLVTTIGCGESRDAAPAMSKQILAKIIEEKNKAEQHLRRSDTDWTIIRPGGLRIEAPTGNAMLVEDPLVFGMINKTDLGALVYAALLSGAAAGRAYTAVDRDHCEHTVDGEVVPATL